MTANTSAASSPRGPRAATPAAEAEKLPPLALPHGPKDTLADAEYDDDALHAPVNGGVPDVRRVDLGLQSSTARGIIGGLGWLDRLLTPLIVVAMILGVVIGRFAPNVNENLSKGDLHGVSAPLTVGLLVMMWPILTKVRYEDFPRLLHTRRLWLHVALSLVLNWLLAPFLMLALAWACLPDLPGYRTGVIMVGVARCIAMVMIWTQIARGESNMCAVIVIVNSLLQIVLFAPLSLLFINVISGEEEFELNYSDTAIAVVIFLGIPLVAGVVTRFAMLKALGRERFLTRFLPFFGPLSLIGLLYTIIIIFASQARQILDDIGPVFRTFVPLVLYFAITWGLTFGLILWLSQRYGAKNWGYQMAVVQAFTAGSNNFELAIAVAVAVYGASSQQALAATIGPLVEVPVLLILSWVSLWVGRKLRWDSKHNLQVEQRAAQRDETHVAEKA